MRKWSKKIFLELDTFLSFTSSPLRGVEKIKTQGRRIKIFSEAFRFASVVAMTCLLVSGAFAHAMSFDDFYREAKKISDEDDRLRDLGARLFFDPRLSKNKMISCASCHQPERGFSNGMRVAIGVDGLRGDKNVPTLLNRHFSQRQFWDGRASTLKLQIEEVLTSPHEMASSAKLVDEYLRKDSRLMKQMDAIFLSDEKSKLSTFDRVVLALERYVKSLVSYNSRYDQYQRGDKTALTEIELRGEKLFKNKFNCVFCHSGPNFTDEKLNPRCYPAAENLSKFIDVNKLNLQKFKTPTLRNLKFTGPYMHNGRIETLAEAVQFYTPSLKINSDGSISDEVLKISKEEENAMVAFLLSLSEESPAAGRDPKGATERAK